MKTLYACLYVFLNSASAHVILNNRANLIYSALAERVTNPVLIRLFNNANSEKFIINIINNKENHWRCTKKSKKLIEEELLKNEKFYDKISDRLHNYSVKINELWKSNNFSKILRQVQKFFKMPDKIKTVYLVPPKNESFNAILTIKSLAFLPLSNMPADYTLQRFLMNTVHNYLKNYKNLCNSLFISVIYSILPLAMVYAFYNEDIRVDEEYTNFEKNVAKICSKYIKKSLSKSNNFNQKFLIKCEKEIQNKYPYYNKKPIFLFSYKVCVWAKKSSYEKAVKILKQEYNTKEITNLMKNFPIIIINEAYNYLPSELYRKYTFDDSEFVYVAFDKTDRMFVFIHCKNNEKIEKALQILKKRKYIINEYYAKL